MISTLCMISLELLVIMKVDKTLSLSCQDLNWEHSDKNSKSTIIIINSILLLRTISFARTFVRLVKQSINQSQDSIVIPEYLVNKLLQFTTDKRPK